MSDGIKEENVKYMNEAIEEALEGIDKGHGGPFGAVIVRKGKIIGRGHNRVISERDCTCHGEIMAIRDACRREGSHDLSGSEIYTTSAPCPMCKGAILWANIDKVYYGCRVSDADDIGFRDEKFYDRWNEYKKNDFGKEICRDRCLKLFSKYAEKEHEIY